ncbi:noncanonical pyrimidine nucleotidase, YjjG family [Flavobacteriaceae bacterium Ap0902]|nr:noncanonical pyrimidine nucleotidase, YjjG family [Flavobacteriaceae bacterium Ap0902]
MFTKDNIRHVFFDLDNTLWDHRGNSEATLRQMFKDYQITEQYNLDFDAWHEVFYEKNEYLWAELREGHIQKQTLRDRRFAEPFKYFKIEDPTLSEKFDMNYLERMAKMKGEVAGAKDLLEYLSPYYTLHVITNGFEEVSQAKIDNAELSAYIETLTCADEIGLRKPDPRLFELAASKAGASKEESVIIGDDWIADVLGGTSFGWKAIFFDSLNDGNQLDGVPNVKKLEEIKQYL